MSEEIELNEAQEQTEQVQPEPQNEAEDAFLEKVFPLEQDENTAPVRAEDGKFAKQEPKQQDAEQAKPKGYDKAAKALKLDGWTDDDLSGMDPERVIALGKKAKDRHSEIGKKLQSRASQDEADETESADDAKGQSAESSTDERETEDDDEGDAQERGSEEPDSQPAYDLKAIIKPVSDAIGLGDEVGDALAKALEKALAPLQSELAAHRQAQQAMLGQRGQELGERAREKLQEDFPSLKDEAKFEKVVDRMTTLAKAKQYDSMEELMRDAAKIELFDDAKNATSKRATSSKRSQGQPVTQTRAMPSQALSLEDREDAALDKLLLGHGRDAARQAYNGR